MKTALPAEATPRIVSRLLPKKIANTITLKIPTFTKSNKTYPAALHSLASEKRAIKLSETSRFTKHSNLIETNKLQLQKMASSTPPSSPVCSRPSLARSRPK